MSTCSNNACNKAVGGLFHIKKLCLLCKNRFCKKCFFPDPNNPEKYPRKGYCWACLLKAHPIQDAPPAPPSQSEVYII